MAQQQQQGEVVGLGMGARQAIEVEAPVGLGRCILYLQSGGCRRGEGRISEEMLPLAWVDRFPTHRGLVASILMYASPPYQSHRLARARRPLYLPLACVRANPPPPNPLCARVAASWTLCCWYSWTPTSLLPCRAPLFQVRVPVPYCPGQLGFIVQVRPHVLRCRCHASRGRYLRGLSRVDVVLTW